jgi:hypothetical protein
MSSAQPGQRLACGPWCINGKHAPECNRLTAALEARDAEHANERLELKSKLAKSIGALDVAREALERVGVAPDDKCYEAGGIARAATARIAQLLGEGTTTP